MMREPRRLKEVLDQGQFAVTIEYNPPKGTNISGLVESAKGLVGRVHGVNVTDCTAAIMRASSLSVCRILYELGHDPVMQMTCRDRNRIAIQGDVLGASAMGVQNILCLTGDGVQSGDQPGAKPVFDLDSIGLLSTIRVMRDERRFLSGRPITKPPTLFLGAAINPFVPPHDFRALHFGKKVAAGAQFVQSQYCYDVAMLKEFMKRVRDMGLDEKCFILIGVGPIASARTARWLKSNVPGVHVPDAVIRRIEGASDQRQEGKRLCIDIINEVKDIKGVHGVHVMAYRQEEFVAEIVHDSGVLKGRQPWKLETTAAVLTTRRRAEQLQSRVSDLPQEMAERAVTLGASEPSTQPVPQPHP